MSGNMRPHVPLKCPSCNGVCDHSNGCMQDAMMEQIKAVQLATAVFFPLSSVNFPKPPKPPLEKGIKAEDVIGWRIWRVLYGDLFSYSMACLWQPGVPITGTPADYDREGVWAFKDRDQAIKKMMEQQCEFVFGSVRLWGDVVEHEDGYRAQNARILTIDGSNAEGNEDATPLAFLREKYQVGGEDAEVFVNPLKDLKPPTVRIRELRLNSRLWRFLLIANVAMVLMCLALALIGS